MAFRFDFPDPDLIENTTTESPENENSCQSTNDTSKSEHHEQEVSVPCEEIYYTEQVIADSKDLVTTTYTITDDISVTCYVSDVLADVYSTSNPDSSLAKVVSSNIDVVPNEYEGGLTVWESSIDLSKFLVSEGIEINKKIVLELGCGAGIPGICAIKMGAQEVHFQDFNLEVIKNYTIPNVTKLNRGFDCKYRFFSGDWNNFSITLSHMIRDKLLKKYNCILTAETIYNPDNYHKLHSVFEHLLSPDGCIYLSAKSHYFGATSRLGGGTFLFMGYLEKQGLFTATVCKTINAAIPREILKIEWKKENS